LTLMVGLLLTMFIGISWAAQQYGIVPMHETEHGYKTVIALLTERHFGQGPFFIAILVATACILFLAANTAFADFPRLCSFVAKDGFMPRQLMSVGDRLVFQNGILVLGLLAALLVWIFHADTHALIPLYALGVFISFTLSQTGMAVKFCRMISEQMFGPRDPLPSRPEQPEKWHETVGKSMARSGKAMGLSLKRMPAFLAFCLRDKEARKTFIKMLVNSLGAFVTLIVTGILLITKAAEGAYLIIVALFVMLGIFKLIRKHYDHLASEMNVRAGMVVPHYRSANILLVPRLHRGVLKAIGYALASAKDVRALHVTLDYNSAHRLKDDWANFGVDMPLVILDSPYRSLLEPVLDYIDQMIEEDPDMMVTVIVPQAVPKLWFQGLLHNNAAVGLKLALGTRRNVVVTNVRYFLN